MCAKLTTPKLKTPLEHRQNRQYLSAVQKLVNKLVLYKQHSLRPLWMKSHFVLANDSTEFKGLHSWKFPGKDIICA